MDIDLAVPNPAVTRQVEREHGLLGHYSVELTVRDRASLALAPQMLKPGAEVFIAALPNDKVDELVAACVQLRRAGLTPVPHLVARNVPDRPALDLLLRRLAQEAGLDRCLILGGDRDKPAGDYLSSLQLLQTGLIQKHGIERIFIGCYPEGHPKISDQALDEARTAKLDLTDREGLDVTLISQFCFEAAPVIAFARRIRDQGIKTPFRVGVAGPADRALLLKYALICGVGNSVRVLKKGGGLALTTLAGETPAAVIQDLDSAQDREPRLGLSGIHFFTFGSLAKSVKWAEANAN
ncbi:MAG: methylenetetrahydrofolate reductase [Caulobacteraceae bacterium]